MKPLTPEMHRVLLKRITAVVRKAKYDPAAVTDEATTAAEVLRPYLSVDSPDEEIFDLALCEPRRVVLREGRLYRFRREGDCKECEAKSVASFEAYGPVPKREA